MRHLTNSHLQILNHRWYITDMAVDLGSGFIHLVHLFEHQYTVKPRALPCQRHSHPNYQTKYTVCQSCPTPTVTRLISLQILVNSAAEECPRLGNWGCWTLNWGVLAPKSREGVEVGDTDSWPFPCPMTTYPCPGHVCRVGVCRGCVYVCVCFSSSSSCPCGACDHSMWCHAVQLWHRQQQLLSWSGQWSLSSVSSVAPGNCWCQRTRQTLTRRTTSAVFGPILLEEQVNHVLSNLSLYFPVCIYSYIHICMCIYMYTHVPHCLLILFKFLTDYHLFN